MAAFGGLALVVPGALGCDGCGGAPSGLRVAGATPYVRCMGYPEVARLSGRVGRREVELDGRTGTIHGLGANVSVTAFAGTGLLAAPADVARAVGTLKSDPGDLLLVLGDLGADDAALAALLTALAEVETVSIVLPGGADDGDRLDRAFEALPSAARLRIWPGHRIHRVVLGASHEIFLAAGAPGGRYAVDRGACGHDADDLEGLVDLAESAPEIQGESTRRWLVSWAAPTGLSDRGLFGASIGDPDLAETADALGVAGGIYAWPAEQVDRLGPGAARAHVVVPPLAGPAMERADGRRVLPGATPITLSPAGILFRSAGGDDGAQGERP